MLGSAPTASVVAIEDSTVHVVDKASASVQRQPELTYAIARLLARRLSAVTAYLVDIKRQYADSNTHLALMDQVLANLITMQPAAIKPGSERNDVPGLLKRPLVDAGERDPARRTLREIDLDSRRDVADLAAGIEQPRVADAVDPGAAAS